TDDFNNTNLIGVGGMSTVYKGVFPDGNQVAVKRLRPEFHNTKTNSNFNLERKLLLDVKHPNIVQVLGSCNSGNLKVLILENMPNGNLDMHPNLPWSHRMDIAGGVAQALAYLHGEWQGANPMHCDLKASSVLLDEKFNAHITDVRLANQSSTIISDGTFSGSIGYMPPAEYALSTVPTKAGDVYSFGTLMMELLTGVKPDASMPMDSNLQAMVRQAFPDKLHSVLDPQILDYNFRDQITMCTKIALHCTNDLPIDRPSMRDVL
ncbi:hypothetical protein SELMODRAFT_25482, partial [Selaginella moellendorffii]